MIAAARELFGCDINERRGRTGRLGGEIDPAENV
jgi:hypothetical protein